jgi:superoxide dismutase, Fe-Mn family
VNALLAEAAAHALHLPIAVNSIGASTHVHALPRLPYGFDALEPHIDSHTMQIHYRKHHQAYIDNLNAVLESYPELQSKSAESLCREISSIPEEIRTKVRVAAGGHWNHSRLWAWLTPHAGGAPVGGTAEAITASFDSVAAFKEQFSKAATGVVGSGWAWLVHDHATLAVTTTPNQDNPLMDGRTPILGLDVWEHAYYLKYQNRRGDYVKAWWSVVNWAEVNKALQGARRG